jgi:hypothetical protein
MNQVLEALEILLVVLGHLGLDVEVTVKTLAIILELLADALF